MRGIMRSFTSCQASDMDRLFWCSLLLTFLPVIESVKNNDSCLFQPNRVIWKKTGHSAVLNCTVRSPYSSKEWKYEWFAFKENSHLRLNLSDSLKYSLESASLHIKSLNVKDSGIYHCAAVSSGDPGLDAQCVGTGTTLVVRDKSLAMQVLLWLSFVLLAIYSLALVTLLLKKYGYNMSVCRRMCKSEKKNSIKKRAQFRDVLQEMYRKRNLDRGKKNVSRDHSHVEAASTEFKSSADDIYQNV
ncbi:uncharacterized protein si:ch211-139g16.8 isoform X1 [Plectropomus leopardus]|uniref:uncharacterized protein si:ch211-139g16.8 isoform X1 n=1 Tax=Plectropomus leopardus TaxID=160734 RepID=UPI001C4C1375|nr:uncharacterized protein si:ch211-139g16.8 isoform X1 [Plectropomus leopardus]XP_042360920.1 uncharacterized protein si:ch211-139g16.8 isoform X1 [Plectropomus leopardus]